MKFTPDLSDRFKSFLADIGCAPLKTSDVPDSILYCPDALEDPYLKLSDVPGAVEDALIHSEGAQGPIWYHNARVAHLSASCASAPCATNSS